MSQHPIKRSHRRKPSPGKRSQGLSLATMRQRLMEKHKERLIPKIKMWKYITNPQVTMKPVMLP